MASLDTGRTACRQARPPSRRVVRQMARLRRRYRRCAPVGQTVRESNRSPLPRADETPLWSSPFRGRTFLDQRDRDAGAIEVAVAAHIAARAQRFRLADAPAVKDQRIGGARPSSRWQLLAQLF